MGSCSSSAKATPPPLPKQDGEVKHSSHVPVSAHPALRECPVCLDQVKPRHWRAIPCDSRCGACVTCVDEHMRVKLQDMPGAEGNAWPFTCPVCEAGIGEAETLQCVSPGHRSDVHRYMLCGCHRSVISAPHPAPTTRPLTTQHWSRLGGQVLYSFGRAVRFVADTARLSTRRMLRRLLHD